MESEKNRVKTFSKNYNSKHLLSQIGFYYVGPGDMVKCHFCNIKLGNWQPEDDPVQEHLKWSPRCPLILGKKTFNIPIDEESLKRILPKISYDVCGNNNVNTMVGSYPETSENHANSLNIRNLSLEEASSNLTVFPTRIDNQYFSIERHRLASFKEWPKIMKQTPKELAEAGFYYTERGDRVKCFCCGGGLKDWEETDKPWDHHAMWYGKCEYLNLMKGQAFIDEILARKNSPLPKDDGEVVAAAAPTDKEKPSEVLNENKMCKICYECEYNTAFFPCGHIIACSKCALSVSICPCCRKPFTKVIRVYFS